MHVEEAPGAGDLLQAVEHAALARVEDGAPVGQPREAGGHAAVVLVEVVPVAADVLLAVAHRAVGLAVVDGPAVGQPGEAGGHGPAVGGVEVVPLSVDALLAILNLISRIAQNAEIMRLLVPITVLPASPILRLSLKEHTYVVDDVIAKSSNELAVAHIGPKTGTRPIP